MPLFGLKCLKCAHVFAQSKAAADVQEPVYQDTMLSFGTWSLPIIQIVTLKGEITSVN